MGRLKNGAQFRHAVFSRVHGTKNNNIKAEVTHVHTPKRINRYSTGFYINYIFEYYSVRGARSRMPVSLSCAWETSPGALVNGQLAVCVFGKAMTSRILSAPAINMTIRSSPNATPPCGGQPWLEGGEEGEREERGEACAAAAGVSASAHAAASAQ